MPRPITSARWREVVVVTACLAGAMTLLQALPVELQAPLRYVQASVADGELWRLLSSNFLHLGWAHLGLNLAGLAIMTLLFLREFGGRDWAALLIACALASTIGMQLFTQQPGWVVGLSGALHGVFVAGAVRMWQSGDLTGPVMLLALGAKIAWEQLHGAMPASSGLIGGDVAVDAHLWGAVGGLLFALAGILHARLRTGH